MVYRADDSDVVARALVRDISGTFGRAAFNVDEQLDESIVVITHARAIDLEYVAKRHPIIRVREADEQKVGQQFSVSCSWSTHVRPGAWNHVLLVPLLSHDM